MREEFKRERKREMRLDTKLENRGKVVPSPLPSLFFPLSPRHGRRTPRRHTGTFSHSFSVLSLTCTEIDDDDEDDDNDDEDDDNIVGDVVTSTRYAIVYGLFIHFEILFIAQYM